MRWESLREMRSRAGHADHRASTGWSPAADVCETDANFVVVVELPGMARDEFDVTATAGSLTIRGTRCGPGCEPAQYVRLERGHGSFVRQFSFAVSLDVAGMTASFTDGILTVALPKAVETRGRRVDVE